MEYNSLLRQLKLLIGLKNDSSNKISSKKTLEIKLVKLTERKEWDFIKNLIKRGKR